MPLLLLAGMRAKDIKKHGKPGEFGITWSVLPSLVHSRLRHLQKQLAPNHVTISGPDPRWSQDATERFIQQIAQGVYQSQLAIADGLEAQLEIVTSCRNIAAQLGDAMGVGAMYGLLVGELGDGAPSLLGPLNTETSWAGASVNEEGLFVVGCQFRGTPMYF